MNDRVSKWLFETGAVRVCPEGKPFWYTSGRIGPFYVNTHFLFGSEQKANDLLKHIDGVMADKLACSADMEARVLANLAEDAIFAGVIEAMTEKISSEVDLSLVDAISGGERRDWFFSLAVAHKLGKPHLTLFKDMEAVLYLGSGLAPVADMPEPGQSKTVTSLKGLNFLHVADLITTASSYERAWVPAIRKLGGEMPWSLVVVDRLQGGGECLSALGVRSLALTEIKAELFESAVREGVLDASRLGLVLAYMSDPEGAMGRFVAENPSFLAEALAGDEKTAARARLCLAGGFYS